jgi:hypothetical protein
MTRDAELREKIQNQDWSETGLKDYLLYDRWDQDSAWHVLAGLDFRQKRKSTGDMLLDKETLLYFVEGDFENILGDYENIQAQIRISYLRLKAFSENSGQQREYDTPRAYIDWALSKQFKPLWLDWAIEHKLYEPNQEVSQNKTGTVTLTTTYSTKWLEIQQAAILEFFSPRREVDAKKDEVVSWIEFKAIKAGIKNPTSVAEGIFTIIKPEDHSPKIRRAGPIKTQHP